MEHPVDNSEPDETQAESRHASLSPSRERLDDGEARVRPRSSSLSPSRHQSNNDEARVTSRYVSPRTASPSLEQAIEQSLRISSPKRSNVSDNGHTASDKAGNSKSSRRSPGDVTSPGETTQPGDEVRNGSTRPTRANKPPAYLGDYVRTIEDVLKSWEEKPNPVNPVSYTHLTLPTKRIV